MKTFLTKYFIEREKSSDLDFHSFLFSRLNKCCGGNIVMFQVINARERELVPLTFTSLLQPEQCGTINPILSAAAIQFLHQLDLKGYKSVFHF